MANEYDADAARREYNRAVIAAQKEAADGPPVRGDFSADGRNTGKSFGFKYPTARDATKWARDVLNKHGLALSLAGHGDVTVENGVMMLAIPYRALHAAGHQEVCYTKVPVVLPAGGTIVRGWGASRTTALKYICLDFLCVRVDDDDELPHASAAAPAQVAPIGLPGDDEPPPYKAPPATVPAAPTATAPDPRGAAAHEAAPVAAPAAPDKLPAASVDLDGAIKRLVKAVKAAGRGDAAATKAALASCNSPFVDAGRAPLFTDDGALARAAEPADYAIIMGAAYEVEATLPGAATVEQHLGSIEKQLSAPAQQPPAPTVAQPLVSATVAQQQAPPPPPEPTAASDAAVKGRMDRFFSELPKARAKRGEDKPEHKAKVLEKINAAVGFELLSARPLDLSRVTLSTVVKLESFLAAYGA